MKHWEIIVNIALCRASWSLNHKYKHMYKSRNKKSSYWFSLLHPFADLRHHCLVTCTIERRKYIIKCKCHHRLELNSATKQLKRETKIFLDFSRVKRNKKKREIFLLFLQNTRTKKNGQKLQKDQSK